MKKILVIEDDPIIIRYIAEFLKEEGFDVYTAEDGVQGIQVAIDIIPDLIICDISMPKKDGYEVCKTLQSIPSTCTVPFIFLTAKAHIDDLRLGMQTGADDYLTKPFEFSELIRSINLRLEKHERFVKQSDERFFALIDNPMIGVYIYQENKFIYSNSMITEILGYSKDELKHFSFEDLVCKKEDEELVKIIRCIKGIHGFVHTDVEMYKKNQSITAVEIFGTKIKFKGRNCLMGNMLVVNSKRRELPESKYSKNIKLSRDETLTLQLICKGLTSIEISEKLLISAKAIEARRAKLLLKTDSKNTADLVMFAIRNRFIEL
ncbi:MAG: hypothetical protein A2275_04710 [Bacteroidetes bacterium RIFOXYA12_FULL_35_11]|nr:MAG: hypothetical protein A2X01_13920 [Bacteroidetes bacterium GWF2_35_48]OFY73978.1 MAG: hypothetical protein A2275_04710 [Bacteroidetes bacterium RIFOXYA12_FULL_35_11]HBX52098.1 hypothetical protein [Bacteroidales bacterium]